MRCVDLFPASIVTAQQSLVSQSVIVELDEIRPYLDSFKPDNKSDLITEAAAYAGNVLQYSNSAQWHRIASSGFLFSLGACMEQRLCTCFHFSTFFAALLTYAGIDVDIVEGRVIENERERLPYKPKVAPLIVDPRDGEINAHVWNLAKENGVHYLVDTAYQMDGGLVVRPIEFDDDYVNTFTFQGIDKGFRHYLMRHPVRVKRLI